MYDNNEEYLLEMDHITKQFPGVLALNDVSLKVKKGEVHSLLGENGAGKSTLMKILMNIFQQDKGDVTFKGVKRTGSDATIQKTLESGIAMIHQELATFPDMTIAENIFLNREPKKGIFVDDQKLNQQTVELFKYIGIDVDPQKKIKFCTTSYIQMVEIARAISMKADLIIMDEPTSAITSKETELLFNIIKKLKEDGKSIIYITHKMEEIFCIADVATVLRDGQLVTSRVSMAETSRDKLISYMVGREITQMYPDYKSEPGEVLLSVKHLSRGKEFKDISFELRAGEILGIAGMMGAGRSELMSAVFGITKPDSGEIYVKGKKMKLNDPAQSIANGMAMLTEDRKKTGLFLNMCVANNISIPSLKELKKGLFISKNEIDKVCSEQVRNMNVKTPSNDTPVKSLSGGNQQKVLLGRWLHRNPEIMIIDEPTRGIDVGAKSEIHKIICDMAKSGKAIIVISSEMPEIIGISTRVLVISNGRLSAELTKEEDFTQETIMYHAAKQITDKETTVKEAI